MGAPVDPEERTTRAILEFTPSELCPLSSIDGDVLDAQTLLANDTCHCEFVVDAEASSDEDDVSVAHSSRRHDKPCSCHVFGEYDCVPNIVEVRPDSVVVSVFLDSHAIVWDLIADLKDVSESVVLRKITSETDDVADQSRVVNLDVLTDKQRQALELAVERGYYEQPSEVTQTDIAAHLGVSKQAFSQRLGAAEQKMLEQLFPR